MKIWARLHFSALFPFQCSGCAVYTFKSSGRIFPIVFSILASFCSLSMLKRWILNLNLPEMSRSLRKLPQVLGIRVPLWCMLLDLSGRHHCIFPKDDSLRRPLPCPEMLIPHLENNSFTVYGYDRCNSRDIVYSNCSSERHTHSPHFFLYLLFSHPFDNLRHKRYLFSGFAKFELVNMTTKPDGPSPCRKTGTSKPRRIPGPEYICLAIQVVIFDELWVVMDIDIRVSTAHCPIFDDSEVNPGGDFSFPRWVKAVPYVQWAPNKRFYIGLSILSSWALPLRWRVFINFGMRTRLAP